MWMRSKNRQPTDYKDNARTADKWAVFVESIILSFLARVPRISIIQRILPARLILPKCQISENPMHDPRH